MIDFFWRERLRAFLRRWLAVPDPATELNAEMIRALRDVDSDLMRDYTARYESINWQLRNLRISVDALQSEIRHCDRGLGSVYPGYR